MFSYDRGGTHVGKFAFAYPSPYVVRAIRIEAFRGEP